MLVLPAPSVASTVMVFDPDVSVRARLQFAVLLPVAVAPVLTPLTVTPVMPRPPRLLSVAVPLIVTLADVTVCPDV
jgi:hypothetical protein